ncbi:hypothetical protein QYF36_006800 [Acer negundo]|nr:hypothetical protein QYF36_006800 [Acer negundo]
MLQQTVESAWRSDLHRRTEEQSASSLDRVEELRRAWSLPASFISSEICFILYDLNPDRNLGFPDLHYHSLFVRDGFLYKLQIWKMMVDDEEDDGR